MLASVSIVIDQVEIKLQLSIIIDYYIQWPFIQVDVYEFFYILNLGCVDDLNGFDGYNCNRYKKYCDDSYIGPFGIGHDWYRSFRAACKGTCSQYASSYCTAVTCKG